MRLAETLVHEAVAIYGREASLGAPAAPAVAIAQRMAVDAYRGGATVGEAEEVGFRYLRSAAWPSPRRGLRRLAVLEAALHRAGLM